MNTNTFLIYLDDSTENSELEFNGSDSISIIKERLSEKFSDIPFFISVPASYTGPLLDKETTIVRNANIADDWNSTITKTKALNIIKISAAAPFVDPDIINEMLEIHTKYLAEFTYSENVPEGFGCDIISRELITSLPEQTDDKKILPLKDVIKKNINQFDVELYYKEPDIRSKRLTFCISDPREKAVMQNIIEKNNGIPAYSEIKTIIESNPEVLYISPSYLEIEITGKNSFETIYSSNQLVKRKIPDMDISAYSKIITETESFNTPFSISLSGAGDPLQHPEIYSILEKSLNSKLLQDLIIETDGTHIDANFQNFIKEKDDSRIKVIVECNGYNNETYSAVHQKDLFEQIDKNITALAEIMKGSLYLQIMKINETEPFLDSYYDFWEQKNITIILQKQNTYLGQLKDRRYYDLTPLERIPCWHLQRDLVIFADGSVPYCKQDINAEFSSFNIHQMPISEIWNLRKELFINDYKKNYASSPSCGSCDEWFTFNL